MKHGIYYAFVENEWNADFPYSIEKSSKIGFDVFEIEAHHINPYNAQRLTEIRQCAKDNGIILTAGIGPSKEKNLSSPDPLVRKAANEFFRETLENVAKIDVHVIGGALYTYWPIDYSKPVDKAGDRARGIDRVVARPGASGPIGQEHAVGRHRQHVAGRRLRRHHVHVAAALGEHAQDVELHAEVVRHHVELRRVLAARGFA